jgi:putative toxin-antitoxin system antitoxin component (TIGR02293 family)
MNMTTIVLDVENSIQNGFAKMLGIKPNSSLQLIKTIEQGFSFQQFEQIRQETGLPTEKLAASIGMSLRTLTRRKKENKLTASESDRLVSISRLLSLSVELFEGNKVQAFRWFVNPNRALGNNSPLEISSTETGSREVENLIGRLENGVFS